jgi:hypothetical protein
MLRPLLSSHLIAVANRPFIWGQDDCLIFVADWVKLATGRDMVAAWRGIVPDEAAARRNLVQHGGFALVFRTLCRDLGLAHIPAIEASLGDIGLVGFALPVGENLTCAIRTPHGWAVRTADGFAVADLKAASVFKVS